MSNGTSDRSVSIQALEPTYSVRTPEGRPLRTRRTHGEAMAFARSYARPLPGEEPRTLEVIEEDRTVQWIGPATVVVGSREPEPDDRPPEDRSGDPERHALARKLTEASGGLLDVRFKPQTQYADDAGSRGHIYFGMTTAGDAECLGLDDRSAVPLPVQVVAEVRRIAKLFGDLAEAIAAKYAAAGLLPLGSDDLPALFRDKDGREIILSEDLNLDAPADPTGGLDA